MSHTPTTPEPIPPPHWDEHQIHHVAQIDGRTLAVTEVDVGTLLVYKGGDPQHHHAIVLEGVDFEAPGSERVSVVYVISQEHLSDLVANVVTRLEGEALDGMIKVLEDLRDKAKGQDD